MPETIWDDRLMHENQENSAGALSSNLKALKKAYKELSSDAKIGRAAGLDQKTVWRMINETNSATIESVGKVAAAFGLATWQVLVPGLDPSNPPVVAMTETERQFYTRLKQDITTLVENPEAGKKV